MARDANASNHNKAVRIPYLLNHSIIDYATPLAFFIQGSPKECFPGLVNFVIAVAYHFFLALPAAFTQPGVRLSVEP